MDQSLLDVRRPLKRSPNNSCSVAAEHAKGDLADDPMPSQDFRQHAHHNADHGGAAIEEFCPLETLTANLSCCCILEPVVVGS